MSIVPVGTHAGTKYCSWVLRRGTEKMLFWCVGFYSILVLFLFHLCVKMKYES